MTLVGLYVSYIIGVPSVKAMVIGIVSNDQYLLRQEYDTQDERGVWIHVRKEFQREKDFIESYHEDQFDDWCDTIGPPGPRDVT